MGEDKGSLLQEMAKQFQTTTVNGLLFCAWARPVVSPAIA
jgi:hypothetical protein